MKWALADFALDLLVEYGLAVGTVVGYLRRASQAVAEWGGRRDLHWRANNAPLKRVLDLAKGREDRTSERVVN